MTRLEADDMKQYTGRKVRIPAAKPGFINPAAGKIGVLTYAGWDDWFYVHVDGVYHVREQLATLLPYLVR